jgi:hypothetical protein
MCDRGPLASERGWVETRGADDKYPNRLPIGFVDINGFPPVGSE